MRTIMLLLIITSCTGLMAQEVVATAGSTFGNSSGRISYTIGEGVAQTFTKGDKTLTQGFHQPSITVKMLCKLKDPDYSVSVFPNPTSDVLNIKVNMENASGLKYLLLDVNGKILSQKNMEGPEYNIHLDQFAAGFYILKVQIGTKELSTFKIMKE